MSIGYWLVLPWNPDSTGGVNQVVLNLNKQLQQKGHKPTIFVASWQDKTPRKSNANNQSLHYQRLRSPVSGTLNGNILYWLTLPYTLLKLANTLRTENIACINPHYPTTATLSFVLLRQLKLYNGSLLLSLHGQDLSGMQATKGLERQLWRYILNNADALITCSHALAKRLAASFPDVQTHIKVIHNGFDRVSFEAERDKNASLPSTLKDTEYLLNIGTYESKKGQDILLQAFALLAANHPRLKLALLGRVGSSAVLENLQHTAAKLGYADRIIFLQNLAHNKIGPILEHAKLFVLPSRIEPFCIAVLEAGAFKLPVIASQVDGLPEILSSPNLGILIKPEDTSALATAIDKILREPEWAKTIGENLNQHIKTHFTWQKATDNYLALLTKNPAQHYQFLAPLTPENLP